MVLMALIAISLFSGMNFLVRDGGGGKRTVNALTVRITLSIALILLLMLSAWQGWIAPHSVGGSQQKPATITQ